MTPSLQAEAVQALPQPPAAPSAPVVAGSNVANPLTTQPMTRADVQRLRDARSQLSDQLQSAQGRRADLIKELQTAPAVAQAGIQARLNVLDARLLQLEQDIQITGRQLALAPRDLSQSTAQDPTTAVGRGRPEAYEIAIVLGVFFVGLSLLRLVWNRGRRAAPVVNREADMRLERLEQAVDAIAIEVERVGESQRYQAKLLGEGQAPAVALQQKVGERVGGAV